MISPANRLPFVVLAIGDIAVDITLPVPYYPTEGAEVNGSTMVQRLGGSACNTAAVLARLGISARLAGHLGTDPFGQMALQAVIRAGIDTSALDVNPAYTTGFIMVPVSSGGQRTMFGFRGCNALPYDPRILLPMLQQVSWLHISGYTFLEEGQWMSVRELILAAHQMRKPTSLDPSTLTAVQARGRLTEIFPYIDLLLISELEANAYAQSDNLQDSLQRLRANGVRQAAVKLGSRGSCYVSFESAGFEAIDCAAFRSRPVADTTGAGDSFNAGFLAGRLNGLTPAACLALGNALAFLAAASGKGIPGLLDLPDITGALRELGRLENRQELTVLDIIRLER